MSLTRKLESGNLLLENRRKTRKPVPRWPVIEFSSPQSSRTPNIFLTYVNLHYRRFLLSLHVKHSVTIFDLRVKATTHLYGFRDLHRCVWCISFSGCWFPTFETTLWSNFRRPSWTFRLLSRNVENQIHNNTASYHRRTDTSIAYFLL
jgi:hypothetical protein